MIKLTKIALLSAVLTCLGINGNAKDDIDIHINGDFRGSAVGNSTVPGWTTDQTTGSATISQGEDWDEFIYNIKAPSDKSKTIYSDFFPILGKTLKIESNLKGIGNVKIGFQAYNAAKELIHTEENKYILSSQTKSFNETKDYFPLTQKDIKFIRIFISAEANAQIAISDIEAEFIHIPYQPEKTKKNTTSIETKNLTINNQVEQPPPALLINDRRFSFDSLPLNSIFQITLPIGSDIDFELGEKKTKNQIWVIESYDANICRIKIEHDTDGIYPFKTEQAEIELEAIKQGTTYVTFSCGEKKFTVIFTVK